MLELSQLIDNAARVLIRAEGDDPGLMWGRRFSGLIDAIAARTGGVISALHLVGKRIEEIEA